MDASFLLLPRVGTPRNRCPALESQDRGHKICVEDGEFYNRSGSVSARVEGAFFSFIALLSAIVLQFTARSLVFYHTILPSETHQARTRTTI